MIADCQLPIADFAQCDKNQNKSAIGNNSIGDEGAVSVRAAIAEELPRVSHFANLVEIQIRDDERVFIARRFRDKLAARIAEVTLAVKLADVPWLFMADSIDCTDEISIRNCVCRLFESPQVFRQA